MKVKKIILDFKERKVIVEPLSGKRYMFGLSENKLELIAELCVLLEVRNVKDLDKLIKTYSRTI